MIKHQLLFLSIISIFFPFKVVIAEFNSTELEAVTVRIDVSGDRQNGGSGVIIARQGQFYTILTAHHVVKKKRSYQVLIINPTNRQIIGEHIIDSNKDVTQINNYDLAEIKIKSSANYPIAEIGDSSQLQKRDDIAILGYPIPSSAVGKRTYSPAIYEGKVSDILTLDSLRKKDGATLKLGVFSETGMSGGAVVNAEEELVGILSEGDKDGQTDEKNSSLAIPIHLYPQWQSLRKYSPSLEELLSKKRWVQANDKTWEMLLKFDLDKSGYLDEFDLNSDSNNLCSSLKMIDKLWFEHSGELFGFRIQKRIYRAQVGKPASSWFKPSKFYEFAKSIGWRRKREWLPYNKVISAPFKVRGKFPIWYISSMKNFPEPYGFPRSNPLCQSLEGHCSGSGSKLMRLIVRCRIPD